MGYKMDENLLENFDIFPIVFSQGKETELHIRPTGGRVCFLPGQAYKLVICALDGGRPIDFPVGSDFRERTLKADGEGGFTFSHSFSQEGQYFLRFFDEKGEYKNQFPVYCVGDDLIGRYPFRGDTHLHSTFSDGRQTPEVVCAQYRSFGYDFLAITDHRRYYPSLNAMAFYAEVPTELCICPGEEVQDMNANGRTNDVHIINFGGDYSINALRHGAAVEEKGTDPALRSVNGDCPPTMTQAEFDQLMQELYVQTPVPEGVDRHPAVCSKWIFDEIRKAGGLGIFAHPYWIKDVYHVPERLVDHMVEKGWFDAFEVLGGELYYEQNGFQALRYYEDRAKGCRYPIVGASDSHSAYPTNNKYKVAATIVFSPENECKALIRSIKDFYSVAVDNISAEARLVGEPRLGRYAWFLLQNYFPRHDALCAEEGRLMKQYATGTQEEKAEALALLRAIHGRVARQRGKYFAF